MNINTTTRVSLLSQLAVAAAAVVVISFTPRAQAAVIDLADIIANEARFDVLASFDSDAVLDTRTGLAWQRLPIESATSFLGANASCINREIGGRFGWRLPEVTEVMSLIEASDDGRGLPIAHPFDIRDGFLNGFAGGRVWTATPYGNATDSAVWGVSVKVGRTLKLDTARNRANVWCVYSLGS